MSSVLRNEDLKEMLESNKESLKLEAMKRIVGVSASRESTKAFLLSNSCFVLVIKFFTISFFFFFLQLIAKGKSASELFPAVVKNVASKNIEV